MCVLKKTFKFVVKHEINHDEHEIILMDVQENGGFPQIWLHEMYKKKFGLKKNIWNWKRTRIFQTKSD